VNSTLVAICEQFLKIGLERSPRISYEDDPLIFQEVIRALVDYFKAVEKNLMDNIRERNSASASLGDLLALMFLPCFRGSMGILKRTNGYSDKQETKP